MHADADKQGLVQGMVTGIRGLCNGLGPAMYGLIFYLFHVDLNEKEVARLEPGPSMANDTNKDRELNTSFTELVPGPPFVFGSLLVILAILVAAFIPDTEGKSSSFRSEDLSSAEKRRRERTAEVRKHLSDDSYSDNGVDSDNEYKLPLIKDGEVL
jgi:hypothetical protein